MFKVCLVIVPSADGEADYNLTMMVPALPREGDYVSVLRSSEESPNDNHAGSEDFIVRRVSWKFVLPDDGKSSHADGEGPVGMVTRIVVECDSAIGEYSSTSHKESAGVGARHFQGKAF